VVVLLGGIWANLNIVVFEMSSLAFRASDTSRYTATRTLTLTMLSCGFKRNGISTTSALTIR